MAEIGEPIRRYRGAAHPCACGGPCAGADAGTPAREGTGVTAGPRR